MLKSSLGNFVNMRPLLVAGGLAAALVYAAWSSQKPAAAEEVRILPPPAAEVTEAHAPQIAVFAGGCFWGTQGVFQHVEGVTATVAGYIGGTRETAVYELTETGTTNHAEAVQVSYDPAKVSYGKLLQIFFSVAHDPTQLNRQGADVGTQYRSAIFPVGSEQAEVAYAYIAQLDSTHAFGSPIVTKVEVGKQFYKAEDYHQDYLVHNPTQPYIAFVEQPRIDALKQLFPSVWRDRPLLTTENKG